MTQTLRERLLLRRETYEQLRGNLGYYNDNDARLDTEAADALDAAEAEIARLKDALEGIALLDEADGHELERDHAFRAVAIATRALDKDPSSIFAARAACRAAAQPPAAEDVVERAAQIIGLAFEINDSYAPQDRAAKMLAAANLLRADKEPV